MQLCNSLNHVNYWRYTSTAGYEGYLLEKPSQSNSYESSHKVMKAFENMKLRSADFMNIAYSTPVGRKNKLESRSFHLRILWEIKRKVDLKAFILYQLFSLSLQNVRKRNLQNVQFRWKLHTLCSIWFFFKIFSLKEIKYNTAGYTYVWKSFHLIKQN